jgi:riboflavin synthase
LFTGIIEVIGKVIEVSNLEDGSQIGIYAPTIIEDIKVGDSISVDGVCQTVIKISNKSFYIQAVGETILKSTFKEFKVGRKVNLERALTLNSRIGGHLIQGHVNETGIITRWFPRGENYFLAVKMNSELIKYCILEGSISVEGISLTIAAIKNDEVIINIIPYTVKNTNLKFKKVGDAVNIETDFIAKHIEQLINDKKNGNLSMNKLKNWGY